MMVEWLDGWMVRLLVELVRERFNLKQKAESFNDFAFCFAMSTIKPSNN
jgi:hypothetical protein